MQSIFKVESFHKIDRLLSHDKGECGFTVYTHRRGPPGAVSSQLQLTPGTPPSMYQRVESAHLAPCGRSTESQYDERERHEYRHSAGSISDQRKLLFAHFEG
jgi:hypothetical protein